MNPKGFVAPVLSEVPGLMAENEAEAKRRLEMHRRAYENTPAGDSALPEIRSEILRALADMIHWRERRGWWQRALIDHPMQAGAPIQNVFPVKHSEDVIPDDVGDVDF